MRNYCQLRNPNLSTTKPRPCQSHLFSCAILGGGAKCGGGAADVDGPAPSAAGGGATPEAGSNALAAICPNL